MNEFKEYLPILIPLLVIQLILLITALFNIFRHPHYKFGNRIIWIVIVLFVSIIGPVVYFIFGRGDDE